MRNYMKAEFYRSFNRMYFWLATAICATIGLCANLTLCYMKIKLGQLINFGEIIPMSLLALSVPMYLIIVFVDMISIEEFKHLTLKNVVGHGLSRTQIYLGKMIVMILLACLAATIILGVFFISGWILLGLGEGFKISIVGDFFKCVVGAIPIWIASIALLHLITFVFEKETLSTLTYLGCIMIIPTGLQIFGVFVSPVFMKMYQWFPTTLLGELSDVGYIGMGVSTQLVAKVGLVGVAYTVILILIGVVYTRRKTFN